MTCHRRTQPNHLPATTPADKITRHPPGEAAPGADPDQSLPSVGAEELLSRLMDALPVWFAPLLALGVGECSAGAHDPLGPFASGPPGAGRSSAPDRAPSGVPPSKGRRPARRHDRRPDRNALYRQGPGERSVANVSAASRPRACQHAGPISPRGEDPHGSSSALPFRAEQLSRSRDNCNARNSRVKWRERDGSEHD